MIFPLVTEASLAFSIVLATLIGVGFGFVLERAGFGVATKLAAQFYFRDLTVFKVMFTAIVTAMLGLVAASSLGLADLRGLSESIASWTWIWPMLAGGLVLGAGFIISGYCPGTSIVSAASGNVDGMFAVGGVVTGTLVYGWLLKIDAVAKFHESGAKEAWFLYDLLPVSPELIAVAVAIMAVLAFIGGEAIEKIKGRPRAWRLTVPAFAVLALFFVFPSLHVQGAKPAGKVPALDRAAYLAEPWRYQIDGKVATDLSTNRTYAVTSDLTAGGPQVAQPATRRSAAPFAKPKKKSGGCSS